MNVLMITNDADVLRDGSAAQSLLREQATVTNRLMVIVMNKHNDALPRKVTGNLWLFPTNSWLPFLKIIDAFYVVRHEIFFQNRLQADLIVGNDPLASGFLGYLLAVTYKKPLHLYVGHNFFSPYYVWRSVITISKSFFARFMISRAYTISVSQENTRAALLQMDPMLTEYAMLVPHYIDVAAIQAQPIGDDLHIKYTQFRALMLVVAPLVPEHNVQVAIESLAEVSKYYTNIGLVIVGDGPRKGSLKRLAQKLAVSDKVMFEKTRDDLISYYKTAHLLMVPSLYEEYETTIEEAAAAGCAIISSSVGIAPFLIEHRKNGYLCDPKVPSEFWNAADALIRNAQVRADMRKNILVSIQAYMSKDKAEHLTLYKASWEAAIHAAHGI